jgi:tripartite-type tricarboxylate transporter receptor subunit TctC
VLAVTTATRSEALPGVPSLGEFLPGYEATNWYGLGAPKATPAEIIDKLNQEVNAALADPKMKARFADLGGTPLPGSPGSGREVLGREARLNREPRPRYPLTPDGRMAVCLAASR